MERTTLSFTAENIITVCLMVFLGFTLFGIVGRLAHSVSARSDA